MKITFLQHLCVCFRYVTKLSSAIERKEKIVIICTLILISIDVRQTVKRNRFDTMFNLLLLG